MQAWKKELSHSRDGGKKNFWKNFLLDVRKRPTLGGKITTVRNVCLTTTVEKCRIKPGAAQEAGGWSHHPKGVRLVPITLTFHIFGYVVTIRVKSENRHPGRWRFSKSYLKTWSIWANRLSQRPYTYIITWFHCLSRFNSCDASYYLKYVP